MGSQAGLVSFVDLMNDEDLEEDLLIGGLFDALGKENLPQLSPPRDEARKGKRKRSADIDKDSVAWLEALCSEAQRQKQGAGGSLSDEKSDVVDGQEQPKQEAESDEDSDCVMLEGNPEAKEKEEKETAGESPVVEDEVEVTKEVGLVACRDFPHARFSCVKFPFKKGHHKEYCALCHCYVCDAPAPCPNWGDGTSIIHHCHADHKDPFWKNMRQSLKQQAVRKAERKKEAIAGSPAARTETFQMWGVQNSPPEGGARESAWGQISFEACFGTMAWGDRQETGSEAAVPTAVNSWAANRYLQAIAQKLAAQKRAPGGGTPLAGRPRARRTTQSPHTPPRTPLDFAPSPPPPLPTEAPPPPPTEPFPGAAAPAAITPLPLSSYAADQSAYPFPGFDTQAATAPSYQPVAPTSFDPYGPQNAALSAYYSQASSSSHARPGYPRLHSDRNQVPDQIATLPPTAPHWTGVPPIPTAQSLLQTYSASQGGLVGAHQSLLPAYLPPQNEQILGGVNGVSSQQKSAGVVPQYSHTSDTLSQLRGVISQHLQGATQVNNYQRNGAVREAAHGNHSSQGPAAAGAWQASGTWENQRETASNTVQQTGRALGYEPGTEYEPWEQPWSWNV